MSHAKSSSQKIERLETLNRSQNIGSCTVGITQDRNSRIQVVQSYQGCWSGILSPELAW